MSHLRALVLALAILASGCVASTTTSPMGAPPSGGGPSGEPSTHAAPRLASARDEPPPLVHKQHVEATAHDPGFFAFDALQCAPASSASCAAYASGIAYFHGDMEGTYAYHLEARPQPDGTVRAHDDGWFVGSIKGCGSGAVAGQFWINISAQQADPAARALVAKATLVLNGATATEGLRGIAGTIPNVFSISNLVTKENDMVFSGDITCADAAPAPRVMREVHVEADLRDFGLMRLDTAACPPSNSDCTFHAQGVAYFSGQIQGSYAYHAWVKPLPNGSALIGDDGWMVATVEGCGSGAFGMRLSGHSTGPAFDPVRGDRLVTATIVPGTGTGPLAGISGSISGTNHFTQDASTKGSAGHLSGSFFCEASSTPAPRAAEPTRTVHVEMDLHDPGFLFLEAGACSGSSCHVGASGIAYLSGTLRGTYAYHAYGDPTASNEMPLGDNGWVVMDIDGCGAGAIAIHHAGSVTVPSAIDAEGIREVGNFTLLPGSGTGALAGASGVLSGSVHFRDAVTRANDGHFSGEVTCAAEVSQAR